MEQQAQKLPLACRHVEVSDINNVFSARPLNMPERNPFIAYRPSLKAQAQLQTKRIDSAIQLLKLQYEAIMMSVQMTGESTLGPAIRHPPCPPNQPSFAAHFDLPSAPKCDVENFPSSKSNETPLRLSNKRTLSDQADPVDISIAKLLADSDSKITFDGMDTKRRSRRLD